MNTNRLARLSLFLAAIAIGGCAKGTGDAARTRKEGTVSGAALGAAVGAGVGALAAKDKGQGALVGAGVGAVVGGMAGNATGDAVAKKKAAYIAEEDELGRQIALARQQTAEQHGVNTSLRSTVTRQQKRLAELTAHGAIEDIPGWFDLRKNVANEIATVDRHARTWQEAIDAHKEFVRKYNADARTTQLRGSLSNLESERTELLRHRVQLEAIAEGPRR